MRSRSLKNRLLFSSLTIIFVFAVLVLLLGAKVIKEEIVARAQNQVKTDLKVARSVFYGEIDAIKTAFNLIPLTVNFAEVRDKMGLDYLYVVSAQDKAEVKSEIVQRAFQGVPTGGIRSIGKDELTQMGEGIYRKAVLPVLPTPKSHPTAAKVLDRAMAIGYAMPVFDAGGRVKSVIYGGKIINRDFPLVDKIRDLVYENKLYNAKPQGTVTIFLDDIRIATNVLDKGGNRAIGTVVSDTVYNKVIKEGKLWLDRAFVVTDWYLTAYEPIRNINGQVIGILYVGVLEKPFRDLEGRIFFGFLGLVSVMTLLAAIVSYLLAGTIARPVTELLGATEKISHGDLQCRAKVMSNIKELGSLAQSFNEMAQKIHQRDQSLTVSNAQLEELNKSYLDLVGFVSHELKGVLGSIIINIYSLKDGYLGGLNEKQKKAVDATARSLDHFEVMVKNYLDLSRIEKNDLQLKKKALDLKGDLIMPALENFERQSQEQNMQIKNLVSDGLMVEADHNLLMVVCNNLLGNALKYGFPGGAIRIEALQDKGMVKVTFYNDGVPIKQEEKELLFKKFSRLTNGGEAKGTGLGLYITRQIIERHGGKIWVHPQENGNAFIFTIKQY